MNSNIPVVGTALMPQLDFLQHKDEFVGRHVGPDSAQIRVMLQELGIASLESLIDATVPAAIAFAQPLALPPPMTEADALFKLKSMLAGDKPARSYF